MADIIKEIEQIKKAVYGEEVRDSIINALKSVNLETENATSKVSGKLDNTSGSVTTDIIANKSVTIAKLSDDLLSYIKSNSGTGNGKSAYEVAVDNGYMGTQVEWLASLKGYTPVKGTDYFTADDINTIVNAVYAKVADGTEVAY